MKNVVDRVEAGAGDVLLIDEGNRRILRQRIAADARARDDDLAPARGLLRRRGRRLRDVGRRLDILRRSGSRHAKRQQGGAGTKCKRDARHRNPLHRTATQPSVEES